MLWPLQQFSDTFARLGVEPPRGVLLYGPPGCGKTLWFVPLASTDSWSVHAVKGLSRRTSGWALEKAVRELFGGPATRAVTRCSSDESDALAPRRGQSSPRAP